MSSFPFLKKFVEHVLVAAQGKVVHHRISAIVLEVDQVGEGRWSLHVPLPFQHSLNDVSVVAHRRVCDRAVATQVLNEPFGRFGR